MANVFRIEVEVEKGYQGHKLVGPWLASIHRPELETVTWKYKCDLPLMREPKEDGCEFDPSGVHVSGCESIGHLMCWIPNRWTMEALLEAGFKINQYDVPDNYVSRGGYQCVFPTTRATFIKSWTFEEILDYEEALILN